MSVARNNHIEDWTTPEALADLKKIAKLSNKEIADYIGISTSTLRRWRALSDEIDEAVTQKTDRVTRAKIEDSLEKSCFEHKAKLKSQRQVLDREGNVHTLEEVKEVLVPADVRAQQYYLKNRLPARWRDRVEVTVDGTGEVAAFIPVPDRMSVPADTKRFRVKRHYFDERAQRAREAAGE